MIPYTLLNIGKMVRWQADNLENKVSSFGAFAYFFSKNEPIRKVALGAFALGISLIGILESLIEMAEFNQKRNTDWIVKMRTIIRFKCV